MKSQFSIQEFKQDAAKFAATLISELEKCGIQYGQHYSKVDHVCYRVASLESYEMWKSLLAPYGEILSEAMVNGRPIATLKFADPIVVSDSVAIALLELPAPKPTIAYDEGFEHIECVVEQDLSAFQRQFASLNFHTGNIDAAINADICFKLSGSVVKFHNQCLSEIIQQEKDQIARKTHRNIVLFDFDDTLVDSKRIFLECFYESFCDFRGTKISIAEFKTLARPTFPEFFANLGVSDPAEMASALNVFKKRWQEISTQVEVPVGVSSLLSCLHSEGFEIAVWTARDFETTKSFVHERNFDQYISHIFAYDVNGVSKPQPLSAMQDFIKGANTFMVGDSVSDFTGAQNINAKFIQAAWVHNANIPGEVPNVAKSPLDCLEFILKS